jgi:hypothetical protein
MRRMFTDEQLERCVTHATPFQLRSRAWFQGETLYEPMPGVFVSLPREKTKRAAFLGLGVPLPDLLRAQLITGRTR